MLATQQDKTQEKQTAFSSKQLFTSDHIQAFVVVCPAQRNTAGQASSGQIIRLRIFSGNICLKKTKSPVLDENGCSSPKKNHQQERDDVGKDQPVFLVMRALFEKPDNHARRHQRCNQQNDLGKKLACLFHGVELGCTGQGTGLRMINTVRLGLQQIVLRAGVFSL